MSDIKSDVKLPAPEFEKLCRAEVLLLDAYPLGEVGTGYSEIVAVTGGSVEGRINGKILSFGGDWGLLHSGSVNEINTRFLIETDDGAYISVETKGKLIMDMETMEQVSTGNPDGVSDYYFRTSVSFKAGAEKYRWLNDKAAFAVAAITDEGNVVQDVYILQ